MPQPVTLKKLKLNGSMKTYTEGRVDTLLLLSLQPHGKASRLLALPSTHTSAVSSEDPSSSEQTLPRAPTGLFQKQGKRPDSLLPSPSDIWPLNAARL